MTRQLSALAPAKINLCLYLGQTRAQDARHELVTLFQSVSLADELRLTVLEDPAARDRVLCPGVEEPNLVTRALQALRERGWDAPPVAIEIDKRIPIAGGMAGGSADAAAALRLAAELAPGRPEEIAELAAELGADVPAQLAPGLVLGTGAGEMIEPFAPLAPFAVLILPAGQPLSTPEVFREADRLGLPRAAAQLAERYEALLAALSPGAELPEALLVNDLEPAARSLCPAVGEALQAARAGGADHALVCGSGPTVAGLFWGHDGLRRAQAAARELGDRFPGAAAAEPVGAEAAAVRA